MNNEFSVAQFFMDESYEYVRRWATAEEAMKAFQFYTTNVAAKVGTTIRVIITDGGDNTNMEWQYGKGITYPKDDNIRKINKEVYKIDSN